MTSKTLSKSNHMMNKIGSPIDDNLLVDRNHIRQTLSPKNFQPKSQNKSISLCGPVETPTAAAVSAAQSTTHLKDGPGGNQKLRGLSNTGEYMSERKIKTGSRSNKLDPLGGRQKCWGSPGQATSSDDGDDATIRDIDYISNSGAGGMPTNIMNGDGH